MSDKPDKPEEAYKAMLDTVPVREEAYAALREIVRSNEERRFDRIHDFFERMFSKWDYSPINRSFTRLDNDVLRFFGHDCFVGFVAIAISEGQFQELSEFLSTPFYKPQSDGRTGQTNTYAEYRPYLESLEHRNKQKQLNRISLHADMLNDTHQHSIVPIDRFLEADLLLYVRSLLAPTYRWYPISGLYLSHTYGAVRLFAKAQSTTQYMRLSPLLFGMRAEEFRTALAPYVNGTQSVVRFDYDTLPLQRLLNLEKLATTA